MTICSPPTSYWNPIILNPRLIVPNADRKYTTEFCIWKYYKCHTKPPMVTILFLRQNVNSYIQNFSLKFVVIESIIICQRFIYCGPQPHSPWGSTILCQGSAPVPTHNIHLCVTWLHYYNHIGLLSFIYFSCSLFHLHYKPITRYNGIINYNAIKLL